MVATKKSRLCALMLALPILSAFASLQPFLPGVSTYLGVGPARGRKIAAPNGSGRILFVGPHLYMLQQETWHALLLTTSIRRETWTDAELDSIERMFPGCEDPLPPWYARDRERHSAEGPHAISP